MGDQYFVANGPSPTTAAQAPLGTGTAIKTHIQIATPSTREIAIVAWGWSFEGSAAATPGRVELIETDVAATVSTLTPTKWSNPGGPAALCVGGTALTGYNASAEGTITAVRQLDPEFGPPTNGYMREFSLGARPKIAVSKFCRVRMTFGTGVNAYTWVVFEE